MKKLRDLLQLDDRMQMIASAAAVGAVLIAAMLVPLAFRTSGAGAEQSDGDPPASRSAVFAAYWNDAPGGENIRVEKPENVPEKQTELCETVMQTLIARCISDQGVDTPEPTGREYTVLHDESGTELQLCRMWLEVRGDWQNWLDVCFDSSTGELYYLYLSRECLTNGQNYPSGEEPVNAAYIADTLAREYGWTLRSLSGGESGSAAAVFSSGSGTLCYQIDCKIYDALVDIRLCCR